MEVVLAVKVPLDERKLLRDAQGLPGRQNGDLGDRIGVIGEGRHHGVAGLVHRHRIFLLGQQHIRVLPAAEDQSITRLVEIRGRDDDAPMAHRCDGGLVGEVGQVGSRETRSPPGDDREINVGAESFVAAVDLEDGGSFDQVRQRDGDLPVEPARAKQGRVQDFRPVGGSHDHDAHARVETVHLRQQLVESLFAFVVGDDGSGAGSPAADGVDLVDEDDGRGPLASLLKQVPDPGRADADEQLHEAGTGDREEGDLGLAGHGASQEGLAGAGGAHHQDASRRRGTGSLIALRLAQEVDHLGDLPLGALVTGDIGELGVRPLGVEHLRPRLADAQHPPEPAGGAPGHADPYPAEDQRGNRRRIQDRTWDPNVEPGVEAVIWTLAASRRASNVGPASWTGITVV